MSAQPNFDPLGCALAGVQLVEASAGTGKTWNICALVLRLLVERPLRIDEILVVTFTNAAAAELRERIRTRIVELRDHLRGGATDDELIRAVAARALAAAPREVAVARLDLALHSFDEAAVLTIHAFCQRALAAAPFTAQVAPARELVDDETELRRAAVDDFWRRHVIGGGDAALAAYLVSGKDSPARWDELLRRHLGQPLAVPRWPDDLDEARARHDVALAGAHAQARAIWRGRRAEVLDRLAAARLRQNTHRPEAIATAVAAWGDLLVGDDPAAVGRKEPDKADLLAATKLVAGTIKGAAPPEHPFFAAADRLLVARAAQREALAHARLVLLRRMLDETAAALRADKRARRVVAFDDLVFDLWQRLAGDTPLPGLAAALRARFPAMLIDEFQDTDGMQFAIFDALHRAGGDGPLFLVGDPKQSIYRFRHADLHAYLAARARAGATHTLLANQRAQRGLIDALNVVFGANRGAFVLPGIEHRDVQEGTRRPPPYADAEGSAPLTVWQLPDEVGGQRPRKAEARRLAIAATAAEIARRLAAAERDEVTIDGRRLAAGDIAVLVRTHREGREMRNALRALGVGAVEHSPASVWSSAEAEDVERVLAAMLAPADAGRLRAAQASAAMGRDAAALLAFDADPAAIDAAVERFAGYREVWRQRGIGVVLRRWIADEGVTARLLAHPGGERRLTNLLHVGELLQRAAADDAATPEAVLRRLREERRAALDGAPAGESAQLRLESDRHLVQVVTVHKSKGLEYGVVFCPLLWGAVGRRPGAVLSGVVAHEADGGIVVDWCADAETQRRADAAKVEDFAEQVRLLYVALTRAVHRLVLVVGNYRIANHTTESGKVPLHWLAAGSGLSVDAWLAGRREPAEIAAAWHALAAKNPGAIRVVPLPAAPGVPLGPPRIDPGTIFAQPLTARLPRGWRIGSFSALQHGAAPDAPTADHDLRVAPRSSSPADAAIDPDDILRFPAGAAAGECLHAVLERIDFGASDSWPQVVRAQLAVFAPALGVDGDRARRERQVLRLLDAVLHTPIDVGTPNPLVLAALPRARRIAEMEFHLPVARLDAERVDAVLAQLPLAQRRLAFAPLEGYLAGRIDLVAEHDGHVFVVDWKFNRLGETAEHFSAASLGAEMRAHGYHLQALIYAVAVRRWLRARGVPAERYGGALYVFGRGLRAAWPGAGVVVEPGDGPALRAFEALVDGGAR